MDRATVQAPTDYLLHLADNAVVLGQRNAQWCGHGPILEEELALANMSLDLIGQARLLYDLVARRAADGSTEDTYAYFRDAAQFRNYTLLELPHRIPLVGYAQSDMDFAVTVVRNVLYSALMVPLWQQLRACADGDLAAIAGKSSKESHYHLRHACDWLVKLGDGTAESHQRMQTALEQLWPYTCEFWVSGELEAQVLASGMALDMAALERDWNSLMDGVLEQATLRRPPAHVGYVTQGKQTIHSEHLSYLLSEMQSLARAHPGAQW
jgi:ring-1,2-phenylacetyl-CoA epoxidase subunit PaaC